MNRPVTSVLGLFRDPHGLRPAFNQVFVRSASLFSSRAQRSSHNKEWYVVEDEEWLNKISKLRAHKRVRIQKRLITCSFSFASILVSYPRWKDTKNQLHCVPHKRGRRDNSSIIQCRHGNAGYTTDRSAKGSKGESGQLTQAIPKRHGRIGFFTVQR